MKVKALLLVLLAALIIAPFAVGIFVPHEVSKYFFHIATALRAEGVFGGLTFTAFVACVALVGIVPGALLGIAAGAVFGVLDGFITSAVGIMAGAVIAFALSRSVMRPLIAGVLGRRGRLHAFDDLITRDSWRIVLLLRISPVMPFSLTSYAFGLSGIAMRDYILGTLAAMPPLLGYVVIGALGASSLDGQPRGAMLAHFALLSLGAVATLALTVHLTRLLARAGRVA